MLLERRLQEALGLTESRKGEKALRRVNTPWRREMD
jgi:hypothetical protein